MNSIRQVAKDCMLPIAMTVGVCSYLVYYSIPQLHFAGPLLEKAVGILQPLLIFTMLFFTFCRVKPEELRPHRWHWWLAFIQGGVFAALGMGIMMLRKVLPGGHADWIVLMESAMLCFICPTATAAAVVTGKLNGDVAGITTYTIIINMVTALLVPLIVPLVQPGSDVSFFTGFYMIMAKVFPLLIMPCLCAWMVRYLTPKLHRKLIKNPDIPFKIWSVGLALALAVTTKSLVKSEMRLFLIVCIAGVSLLCCILQFVMGHIAGKRYHALKASGQRRTQSSDNLIGRKTTCGQALGQKNTLFAIWMGYTFLTPETAVVGGFYSIWHNLFNAWQIYRAKKNM